MERQDIQQQVMIETETLGHVVSALRTTIGWEPQGSDFSRKLSSLRFVCESFERHMQRLFELEQAEGYMAVVVDSRPELSDEVRGLRSEHVQFGKKLRDILARLTAVEPTGHAAFAQITHDLVTLLDQLDKHHHHETRLLQEALLRDEGGEG